MSSTQTDAHTRQNSTFTQLGHVSKNDKNSTLKLDRKVNGILKSSQKDK